MNEKKYQQTLMCIVHNSKQYFIPVFRDAFEVGKYHAYVNCCTDYYLFFENANFKNKKD